MGIAIRAPEGWLIIAQDEVLGHAPKNRTESRRDGTSVDRLHLREVIHGHAQSTPAKFSANI
jgi:hypothetical protein